MNDNLLTEDIERYLNGEMSQDERVRFEILRNENPDLNSLVAEHKQFGVMIKQYGERLELEKRLNAIHDEIDINSLKEELMIHPSLIVQLWRNHHSKIAVAASIAIFAVLSTLFLTGYLNDHDTRYTELRRKMESLKRSTDNLNKSTNSLIHDMKSGNKAINPGKFGGTGFVISSNGYIVTDYHVINGADSVYVQNYAGESFHTKVVYTEPLHDIAVLEIVDSAFKPLAPIPYNFKKVKTDLGEEVFTMGFPTDAINFGPGYLTSGTGFNGDSTAYQVSIPVNFGNSGGPLLDTKGNIIGIINAKQTHVEGASYAIKSSYLLKAIQDIPADSLNRTINLNNKNTLAGLTRIQQIKKLQGYVFMVKVYNQ